jgi:hypothetical protein
MDGHRVAPTLWLIAPPAAFGSSPRSWYDPGFSLSLFFLSDMIHHVIFGRIFADRILKLSLSKVAVNVCSRILVEPGSLALR